MVFGLENGISGNFFNPSNAGVGVHVLTYTYVDPSSNCSNSDDLTIEVFDLPVVSANDTSYCNTPGFVDLPTSQVQLEEHGQVLEFLEINLILH